MMKTCLTLIALALCLGALAACADQRAGSPSGPVLLSEASLEPVAQQPTRILSPTPDIASPDEPADPAAIISSELVAPVQVVTIDADFIIVTPTLPPSKTPTATPTHTITPTVSPTPTQTVTATATAPLFPTSVIIPVTAVVPQPIDVLCPTNWDFIQPPPPGCPFAPATVANGVYQTFERGYMIWDGSINQIYVLFNDGAQPYWTRFDDTFVEGTGMFPNFPWKDPAIDGTPRAPGLYQPVRGFGRLWRNAILNEDMNPQKASVMPRVGWATMEQEQCFSLRKQTRQDGTLFINNPYGEVFQLIPGGVWMRYAGYDPNSYNLPAGC